MTFYSKEGMRALLEEAGATIECVNKAADKTFALHNVKQGRREQLREVLETFLVCLYEEVKC